MTPTHKLMLMKARLATLAVLILVSSLPVFGQAIEGENITIEEIFVDGKFRSDWFGPARWLDDGSGYTTLEPSETVDGARDIVRYSASSGSRSILVSATDLTPAGSTRPLSIHGYTWSGDETRILIFTNSQRVWRQNTRGDFWVFSVGDKSLKQVGAEFEPSTLMFAKFDPSAGRVAYVQKNNLYVEDIASGEITQLTSDGSRTTINGTFDWVYEEEFFLRDGFRWSPDGSKIAYWQLDASGVRDFLMINNTDSLYSFVVPVQYPKAGGTNSAARVGVVSSRGGDTDWFRLSDDERNHYIPRMDWAANSTELVIQHMNRAQNQNEVILADTRTKSVRVVHVDSDAAWVDVVDDLVWLDRGQVFTWVSEVDGWRHIYRTARDGAWQQLLTPGDYDVMSIAEIDEDEGWIYFYASPENPTQQFLYRVALDGSGELERITPEGERGHHMYQISPNAKWAIHTYSSRDTPVKIDLVSLPGHRVVRTLVSNENLTSVIDELDRSETIFFRVDAGDDTMLDGWEMRPRDFDPTKKYPVLFHVYGEPWSQTVVDRWSGSQYLWHHLLTEKGYIVMSIDNRGTPAPRGREWRKVVYGAIGVLASADQAAAARQIAARDYVDESKIGIWGWSGGGSMTLNAMFRYPDIYNTGMSIAPVPDQRYYDTIYQERYSGHPETNADGYRIGSPITFAENLEGNLLVVHGTGDDNVHYQGTEALVNELIKHNKHFTMMSYPNRSHGIWEGAGTTLHLYTLLTRYLVENMPPSGHEDAM
ncbi:MAG: S9 family peptidase [Rhodothermales bacterium]|nr:S9 family peptidase [Rhodothermales bacterium]